MQMQITCLCLLVLAVSSQTYLSAGTAPLFQVGKFAIVSSGNSGSYSTTVPFNVSFSQAPDVVLGIGRIQNLSTGSAIDFKQQLFQVKNISFTHMFTVICLNASVTACGFSRLGITYMAYRYHTYSFIQAIEMSIQISQNMTVMPHFYNVTLLSPIDNLTSNSIGCYLSGFKGLKLINRPQIAMNCTLVDQRTYVVQVAFINITITQLIYNRLLINSSVLNQATSQNSMTIQKGESRHYLDYKVVWTNLLPKMSYSTMFFGLKSFSDLTSDVLFLNSSFFNNTATNFQAFIEYATFNYNSCGGGALFTNGQNLCYGSGSPNYYQQNGAMRACHFSCYRCSGPLSTNCMTCASGRHRILVNGSCGCKKGYYQRGSDVTCRKCSIDIYGCQVCTSNSSCSKCMLGCTQTGSSSVVCTSCPFNSTNITGCPSGFYYQYQRSSCECLPMTYYNILAGKCLPCHKGCYHCLFNATYCLYCLQGYILRNSLCVHPLYTYSLLGFTPTWAATNPCFDIVAGIPCPSNCPRYQYKQVCYQKCPAGTFAISVPSLQCLPCVRGCQFCPNYTLCLACQSGYYMIDQYSVCRICSSYCIDCIDLTNCTQCQSPYTISNGTCVLTASLRLSSCSQGCLHCGKNNKCVQCKMSYFLNAYGTCQACFSLRGVNLQSDGICRQICGDGIILKAQCDDNNTKSGDGCSSICQIQQFFTCKHTSKGSSCWSDTLALDWHIYTVFGHNQIAIQLKNKGPTITTNHQLKMVCNFNYQLKQNDQQWFIVQYSQPIVTDASVNKAAFLLGQAWSPVCNLTINNIYTYQIGISLSPLPLLIDRSSPIQRFNSFQGRKTVVKVASIITLFWSMLGLSPLSSVVSLKTNMLLLSGYFACQLNPVNSFSTYQALIVQFLMTPGPNTQELTQFQNWYNQLLLLNSLVTIVCFVIFQFVLVKLLLRAAKWLKLIKMTHLLTIMKNNRHTTFSAVFSSYEVILWISILKVVTHSHKINIKLIVLVALHALVIIASKIHLFLRFRQIKNQTPAMKYILAADLAQNLVIAYLISVSTSRSNASPICVMLLAAYVIFYLASGDKSKRVFKGSGKVAVWNCRICLGSLCLVQLLRIAYAWCSILMTSASAFQSVGAAIGATMDLLGGLTVTVGCVVGTIGQLMFMRELWKMNQSEFILHLQD